MGPVGGIVSQLTFSIAEFHRFVKFIIRYGMSANLNLSVSLADYTTSMSNGHCFGHFGLVCTEFDIRLPLDWNTVIRVKSGYLCIFNKLDWITFAECANKNTRGTARSSHSVRITAANSELNLIFCWFLCGSQAKKMHEPRKNVQNPVMHRQTQALPLRSSKHWTTTTQTKYHWLQFNRWICAMFTMYSSIKWIRALEAWSGSKKVRNYWLWTKLKTAIEQRVAWLLYNWIHVWPIHTQTHTHAVLQCAKDETKRRQQQKTNVLKPSEGKSNKNFRFLWAHGWIWYVVCRARERERERKTKMPHAAAADSEFECRSTRHMQKIYQQMNGNRSHPIGMENGAETM